MLSPRTPEGRVQYLQFLLVLGATILSVVHLFTRVNYPTNNDPYALRLVIAGLCLSLAILSVYSNWVRDRITVMIYFMVVLGVSWILYMLHQNSLSATYVVISILGHLACSLVMAKKQHLLIYSILFLFGAAYTVYNIPEPIYNPTNYLIHISVSMVLLYIVVGNYVEANLEASSMISNFQSLIDNTETAYCLLDTHGELVMFNQVAKRGIFDMQGKEAKVGESFYQFVMPEEIENFKGRFLRACKGEMVEIEREIAVTGSFKVWLDLKYIPIKGKGGEVTNVLLSVRDITDQVVSVKKIEKKNEELEKINGELDRFVYRAAHDLRAPLSSVLGLINVASMEESKGGIKKYLGLMTQSVDKLNRYINDVIQHSYNSRAVVNTREVNLQNLVEKAFESHTFMEGAEGIEKQIAYSNGKAQFYSDPGRLEIIINNLISNAIKYQDPEKSKRKVDVKITVDDKQADIEVEDNGIGISEEQLDKIFDFFYRGSELAVGSGIGLYIAKEAVDKINGKLEVSSQFGQGTKFRLIVPNGKNAN